MTNHIHGHLSSILLPHTTTYFDLEFDNALFRGAIILEDYGKKTKKVD